MNTKTTIPIFLLLLTMLTGFSGKEAYTLYNADGKKIHYQSLLEKASEADVILFGELHNNPICHWLQYELTADLYEIKKDQLILGAEMFETDDQVILDEYLGGKISEKTFKDEAKEWTNYQTDYKPLVDFAKQNKIPFVATNIPRRYANMVFNRGIKSLDSLSTQAKSWICPLPFPYDSNLACYKNIAKATGGHGGENLKLSQAIKDATMSHWIGQNRKEGNTFLHYNGTYHSQWYESMVWYLERNFPNLKILTIHTIESQDMSQLPKEEIQSADIILQIPSSMTKTH